MFEDPNGIKHIGTPAWKTKNYYSTSARMEHGVGLDKKMSNGEYSPERNESVQPEKIV